MTNEPDRKQQHGTPASDAGQDGDPRQPGEGRTPGQGGAPDMGGPDPEDLVPGLNAASEAEETVRRADLAAEQAQTIERMEAELADLKDKLMRALAETENVRRRAERDRKDAETYGGTKLARDLLSVHDNLERALASADEDLRQQHPGFLEGVELTRRELLNAFAKHRIEPVVPEKGEKFDPHRHQAMFEAPVPGATPGTVIEVMQTGFVIADRLLRPALVGVAKAQPAEEQGRPQHSEGPDPSDPPEAAEGRPDAPDRH